MNEQASGAGRCIETTCPYCGVGCGVDARVEKEQVLSVRGTREHPANLGRLCVKGSALHETLGTETRLLAPRIKDREVDWDTALDTVASGIGDAIERHGPSSIAFYLSGQLLTEDYYVANKLMKGFIGSANIDTNSRLCMASAVVGHKRAFGADAVPLCYEDLELCDLLILTGSNAAWTHPVLYQRIEAAKQKRPGMRVVVLDPRATQTCDIADLHLPLRPGSDAWLFNGLLRFMDEQDAVDRDYIAAHCNGFDAALAACGHCSLAEVAARTGLSEAQLSRFYSLFCNTERVISFFSQGINQSASGSDKCNAIINCHLAGGRIGKPGTGPFSITGQPNAMGGREVGGLANQLAAHMDFRPEDIDRVQRFWDAPNMVGEPGHKAVDMFRAIDRGEIRVVWIMATNPLVSLPQSDTVRRALERCDLVIVSDCVARTDTSEMADILLPAAGWGEKSGTVTNSERCISRQRALLTSAGQAKPDWWIISQVAQRLGFGADFDYEHPRDIFVEHAALSGFENTGQRLFDISGLQSLSRDEYDRLSPVQWPVTEQRPAGTRRLFEDGCFATVDGRARFVPIEAALPAPQPDERFPWLLNSGRIRDQWHTMTRTGLAPRLMQHVPGPFVSLHPRDAEQLGLSGGELLQLDSEHGRALLPLSPDPGMRQGEVFVPVHWNGQFAGCASVGRLFGSRVDPHSGQPESKYQPVKVVHRKMAAWYRLLATRTVATDCVDYWHRRPVAAGHEYTFAREQTAGEALPDLCRRLFAETALIEYQDELSGEQRVLVLDGRGVIVGLMVSAPTIRELEAAAATMALPAGADGGDWLQLAGQGGQDEGRIICSCHEVGEQAILAAIRDGHTSPQALGEALRCGTNCGSCIPELKKLISTADHNPLEYPHNSERESEDYGHFCSSQ